MSITEEQLKILMGDLNPSRVSKRSQGGRSLSYLEAWDVKATLIRVFGFGGFSADVLQSEILEINRNPEAKDSKGSTYTQIEALAKVTVRLTIHGDTDVTYTESAAASQKGRDVGEVVDFALKTAESDALKRAAIYLGTQFGLSLYQDGSTREVIKVIVAPDQKWPTEESKKLNASKTTTEAKAALEKSLGAKQITEEVYADDLGSQPEQV